MAEIVTPRTKLNLKVPSLVKKEVFYRLMYALPEDPVKPVIHSHANRREGEKSVAMRLKLQEEVKKGL